MSLYAVKQYQSEVEKIIDFGGTKKETAIRTAFHGLLNEYAKQKGLMLITELSIKGSKGKTVTPDETLKDALRQDWGYWESKDEADNIVEEIEIKFNKGYPRANILFEDSNTAILIQQGNGVMRADMKDADVLDRIIKEFTTYERPEVENFHKAIELFKLDIPNVTNTIRDIILAEEKKNTKFNIAEIEKPRPKLKVNKENGTIVLDDATTLTGIPLEAWQYKLGNRSALEWILDQHKEKKPTDPTIAEKFNTYQFADYKQQVIDLLKCVYTVSIETMKILNEMAGNLIVADPINHRPH